MTRVVLLNDLKLLLEEAVKDMKLPTQVQKGDEKKIFRAPKIHLMSLPDSRSYEKQAPYIIIQLTDSAHFRKEDSPPDPFYKAVVRFVYCVYDENEEEGNIMLLNLMDRTQEVLLKKIQVGKTFVLDEYEGIDGTVFFSETAPFYTGTEIATFKLIPIQREVDLFGEGNRKYDRPI